MSQALTLLGFAQRSGAVASGETAVAISLKRGAARLMLIAQDASHHTHARFVSLATSCNVPFVCVGTREGLGTAIGKSPRSIVAVEDSQFAQAIRNSLREEN